MPDLIICRNGGYGAVERTNDYQLRLAEAGISFGITEYLLYDIDLGGLSPETHHSKDSVYEFSGDRLVEETCQTHAGGGAR